MAGGTGIQWTDETWNPVRGCSRVSSGCENCYAESVAHRFSQKGGPYEGLTVMGKKGPRWSGKIKLVHEKLSQPLRWTRPRLVFVNSMSDLFHEDIPNEYIAAVFGVMAASKKHRFQVLTKRPDRMLAWFDWLQETADREAALTGSCKPGSQAAMWQEVCHNAIRELMSHDALPRTRTHLSDPSGPWPLPNVWLGVSAEDQKTADERVPKLLKCPAAIRWVSAEPLLGPITFRMLHHEATTNVDALLGRHGVSMPMAGSTNALDWIVVGGESGPKARRVDVAWMRKIIAECEATGVPVFVKQLGAMPFLKPPMWWPGDFMIDDDGTAWPALRSRKGGDPDEWPEDLRVRRWPEQ